MAIRFSRINEKRDSGQMVLDALPRLFREVPYYRAHSVDGALPVITRAQLSKIPFQQLVPDSLDAAAELMRGSVKIASTSGSTSTPIRTLLDAQAAEPIDYWRLWGVPGMPRFACLTSPACMGESCGLMHPGFLYLPATKALFTENEPWFRELAQQWSDFAPDVLLVNPVYLHWAMRGLRRLGLEVPKPRVVVCSYQYLSHTQRRGLAPLGPLTSNYGATELAGTDVAFGCPTGHLHVMTDRVHLEERESPHPRARELIISTPLSRTAPMLRYSPGDLGLLGGFSSDGCALDQLPLLELHGRLGDCLETPQRTFTTREIDDALEPAHWLEFYSVRQTARGPLRMSLVANEAPANAATQVKHALEHLGFTVAEVAFVETLTLSPSLKLQLTGPEESDEAV